MFQVYRLNKTPVTGNSHTVCREERWSLVRDQEFSTKEEAEQYVIQKNFRFCSYDLGLDDKSSAEEIRSRCLVDPTRAHRREYFLEKPNIPDLIRQLRNDSIKVIIEH